MGARIQNRLDVIAENGIFSRVLNLPVSFFSEYSAGGLSQRITAFADVPKIITDTIFVIMNMVVAVVMSLPILFVAPELLPAGLGAIVLVIIVQIVTTMQERRLAMLQFESAEKNGSMVFDLFSGAQRLKLSGGEDRAYARWLRGYTEQAAATYSTRFPLCARTQLVASCRLIGLLMAFYLAYKGHVSVASFAAFFHGLRGGHGVPRCNSSAIQMGCTARTSP
ncbi:MAG: hypothetical protein IKF78_02305 [Atopobiaceae bacterium]|nr:hypothetical protein [Atopobiaceae bacterium]